MSFDSSKISLNTHAVLCNIGISSYSGNKLDRLVSDEVAASKNSAAAVSTDAFRVNKVIYDKRFLRPVTRISLQFYKWLRARSHEWSHGTYLIKAEALNEVLSEYQKAKVKWLAALDELKSDAVRDEALQDYKDRAGDAFDPSLWPSVDELDERFTFELDIEQLPDPATSSNLIFKIGNEAAERIAQDTEKRLQDKAAEISKATAQRIAEVVNKIHAKLTESDNAVFRDSLIGNLREAVELVDTLNITGDPEVTKLRDQVVADLCNADPETLRKDKVARAETARKAKALSAKLAKFSA